MSVFITIDMLYRYHHYATQFLPNETASLLIGFQQDRDVHITNFVHSRILSATERHVTHDFHEDMKRAKQYYTIGFAHTHPGEYSIASASDRDYVYFRIAEEYFFKEFRRMPYFLIYAPCQSIFSIYTSQGRYEDRHVII